MYVIEICIRGNWDKIDGRLNLADAVAVARESAGQQCRKTRILAINGGCDETRIVWTSQAGFTEMQSV